MIIFGYVDNKIYGKLSVSLCTPILFTLRSDNQCEENNEEQFSEGMFNYDMKT